MNYQRKILNRVFLVFLTINLVFITLIFLKPILGKDITITIGASVFIISTILLAKIDRLDAKILGVFSDSIKKDLGYSLLTMLVIFPAFFVVNHFYQIIILNQKFDPALRNNILTNIVNNLLLISIPEEIFFRGYIQGQLYKEFSSRRYLGLFSIPNLITSTLFSLGHFITNPRLDRLAVFFPSLLFGYLRDIRGNIYPSIVLHWFSNVLMYIILGMYR